jgi:sodium/hydrogen antiporter
MLTATAILAVIIVWAVFSAPLDRRGITSALVFSVAGLVLGASVLGWIDISPESEAFERLTEIALVLLLFGDASRLDLRSLRGGFGWPSRLLFIGLPLTMLAGIGVGMLTFPGMALASVVLLSTMLVSTDAALGQKVVTDPAVPARVRQALDVESGLNDGLAVPFFLVALEIANADLETLPAAALVGNMAAQIGWGLTGGLVAGVAGGLLFRVADRRGWIGADWRQIVPLAAALAAYAIALTLGGSGFIAAFVGGMAFGSFSGARGSTITLLTEESGGFLAAVVWIGFGSVMLTLAIPYLTWQVLLYALLSLTVVRMLPVAIAFAGQRVGLPTVAFIGWFGPRGLASLVFVLLAVERGIPDSEVVLTTVLVTVALSVILHGLTSVPFVALYRRWYEGHAAEHPAAEETLPVTMPRGRRVSLPGRASGSSSQGGTG